MGLLRSEEYSYVSYDLKSICCLLLKTCFPIRMDAQTGVNFILWTQEISFCFYLCFVHHIMSLPSRWLFEYLKVDSINLSSRSLSVVLYLKVQGSHNQQTIFSYRTLCSKESYPFFTTKHSVVKNLIHSLVPNILQ